MFLVYVLHPISPLLGSEVQIGLSEGFSDRKLLQYNTYNAIKINIRIIVIHEKNRQFDVALLNNDK